MLSLPLRLPDITRPRQQPAAAAHAPSRMAARAASSGSVGWTNAACRPMGTNCASFSPAARNCNPFLPERIDYEREALGNPWPRRRSSQR